MKKIALTQNQYAVVDDWWYDYLMQWKWQARWSNVTRSYYAARTDGDRKNILMHRIVAKTPDGMFCDHIHHNTLDNREAELRNVTRSQSSINRGVQKSNKLRVLGVSRQTKSKNYRVILDFEGTRVLDKTFKTLNEAVASRREAEKKYFGEYANET